MVIYHLPKLDFLDPQGYVAFLFCQITPWQMGPGGTYKLRLSKLEFVVITEILLSQLCTVTG